MAHVCMLSSQKNLPWSHLHDDPLPILCICFQSFQSVCVCVCVCARALVLRVGILSRCWPCTRPSSRPQMRPLTSSYSFTSCWSTQRICSHNSPYRIFVQPATPCLPKPPTQSLAHVRVISISRYCNRMGVNGGGDSV